MFARNRFFRKVLLLVPLCGALSCSDVDDKSDTHTQHTDPPASPAPVLTVDPILAELIATLSPVPPVPQSPTNVYADNQDAAHFGQYLFFETSLSTSGDLSCASCHRADRSFTDGFPVAIAAGRGERNTLSIWNSAHFAWYNWDGSADTLWAQATRPFETDHELASTRTTLARRIGLDADLRSAYEAIFGDLPPQGEFEVLPMRAMPRPEEMNHPDHVAWNALSEAQRSIINQIFINCCKSIEAYQRLLVSADSPFDRFAEAVHQSDLVAWAAKGNPGFGEIELMGFELFAGAANCIACHAGPLFTDSAFHSVRTPPMQGGLPTDPGRYAGLMLLLNSEFRSDGLFSDAPDSRAAQRLAFVANPSTNWGRFRTPSLRNVGETSPYMHAGQFENLQRVIQHYSTFQDALPPDHHTLQEGILRPLNLTNAQANALMAFLLALSDTSLDEALLRQPTYPFPAKHRPKPAAD